MAKNSVPTKTQELYGGTVLVDFYGEGSRHDYQVSVKKGSVWTPKSPLSVTASTGVVDKSGALMGWAVNQSRDFLLAALKEGSAMTEALIIEASKQHHRKKAEAADIGTQVHEWAEKFIKGLKPAMPDDPKVLNGVTAFLSFIDQHEIKFISTEQLVYSKKHDYVGLGDCEFTAGIGLDGVKEKHKIVHFGDFKTANGFYDEYRFQVAAYQAASTEESGKEYGDKWIIRFGKDDADFHVRGFAEQDQDFAAFLGCLTLKRRLVALKEVAAQEKKMLKEGGKL